MAEEAQVVEQTIADETVLKKYKEAGEITNSWVEKQKCSLQTLSRASNLANKRKIRVAVKDARCYQVNLNVD